MITIKDIPLRNEEYKTKKLPYYMTDDEKKRAENGEDIYNFGTKYSLDLPNFGDSTDDYFESLVAKHADYNYNAERGDEITRFNYSVMAMDWYFYSAGMTINDDGSIYFIVEASDDNSNDIIVVKSDVLEYGMAAAMEAISLLNESKESKE